MQQITIEFVDKQDHLFPLPSSLQNSALLYCMRIHFSYVRQKTSSTLSLKQHITQSKLFICTKTGAQENYTLNDDNAMPWGLLTPLHFKSSIVMLSAAP